MPSNRELKEEAEALGRELGVSVETDNLSNSKLKDLVESLYAQLDAKGAQAEPESEAEPEPESEPEPEPKKPEPATAPVPPAAPSAGRRYIVAPRHSIVGSRGVRGPGKEVLASDFGNDDAAARAWLDELVTRGVLVKQ